MVAFSKIAFTVCLATRSLAAPLTPSLDPLHIFETLIEVPAKWALQGPAKGSDNIKAQIGLKQGNVQGLQDKLLDVSNPDSPNYGKWLTQSEVDAFVAPPAENVAAVKAWLTGAGITQFSQPSSDWIEFTVPVSTMESLLSTKYQTFLHQTENRAVPRTMQYSVPESLHGMIDMITPTTAFYSKIAPGVSAPENEPISKRATCNTNVVTPSCIRSLYNVDYTSKGQATVATTEFIQIAASHDDFEQFGQAYQSGLQDFTDVSVSGGSNPGSGDENALLEGNLDTQFAGALSSPNPSQYLAIGPSGNDFTDEIANFASYLTTTSSPPSSVSTSYGGEEQQYSSSYLTRVCNEFMKAGSLGISVFFSSGDFGVGGLNEPSCNNGFYAQWPAACPWITSVGGSQFNGTTEVVAQFAEGSRASSGGGFSGYFAAPSYQSGDTAKYVSYLGNKYSGLYNPKNRGFPDVALISKNFQTVINGETYNVYGTSASAPSWAALVSVLNDYRKSEGKSNLGFINTLLYSQTGRTALRDITAGSNQGCNSNGYSATTGWDPATGLGSLDFGKLRAML